MAILEHKNDIVEQLTICSTMKKHCSCFTIILILQCIGDQSLSGFTLMQQSAFFLHKSDGWDPKQFVTSSAIISICPTWFKDPCLKMSTINLTVCYNLFTGVLKLYHINIILWNLMRHCCGPCNQLKSNTAQYLVLSIDFSMKFILLFTLLMHNDTKGYTIWVRYIKAVVLKTNLLSFYWKTL